MALGEGRLQIGFGQVIEQALGFLGIAARERNIENAFGFLLLGAPDADLDSIGQSCTVGVVAPGDGPQQQGAFEQFNQGGDV